MNPETPKPANIDEETDDWARVPTEGPKLDTAEQDFIDEGFSGESVKTPPNPDSVEDFDFEPDSGKPPDEKEESFWRHFLGIDNKK